MSNIRVNLACGVVYVSSPDWINIDFTSHGPDVQQANLLARLPLENDCAEVVYASHFLEHIPRGQVPGFLSECLRILKPNGLLRLVVPDLENLCREYLACRESGEHEKADFVVMEMIDQCIRQTSGGELGRSYEIFRNEPTRYKDIIEFVRYRTGERLLAPNFASNTYKFRERRLHHFSRLSQRIRSWWLHIWLRFWVTMLPSAFRAQNVSMAAVGERHHWLWDFHQLRRALESAGFVAVSRQGCMTSCIPKFPFVPLDADEDGQPRMGNESMFVEARRPI